MSLRQFQMPVQKSLETYWRHLVYTYIYIYIYIYIEREREKELRFFLLNSDRVDTAIWMHYMDAD